MVEGDLESAAFARFVQKVRVRSGERKKMTRWMKLCFHLHGKDVGLDLITRERHRR